MNYELAKELKDAGFPQTGTWHITPDGKDHDALNELQMPDWAYIPSLSELIEACGDDFLWLRRHTTDDLWDAESHYHREVRTTPEEAVARLWLSLNPRLEKKV